MANFEKRSTQAKKGSLRSMIVILLIIIILAGTILSNFGGFFKKESSTSNNTSPATESSNQNASAGSEPVFVKQGELGFLNSSKKETHKIDIELATTDEKRTQGLMFRSNMGSNQGMLFIFERQGPQAFWMENTKIPLDIIYIDKDLKIVSISKNTVPYSRESIPSKAPAQYVLEVNAGYTDAYNIKEGDFISYKAL